MALSTNELGSVLEELIAALDRRVPRVEQAGEAGIARDAAALRAKAVKRLAGLVRDRSSHAQHACQLVASFALNLQLR